ncbi:hypothetical protein G4V39_01445 [Thermosulfuriphilus ammonigenes]|uniref:Uncharacterized protein n=1 Tax=Thermosulfuriphilus ammonigenes TaxID=1936021 RepID=A0A6G7PTK5_9BACT|nr:hypothetical protein [Thermosulfuriphilus ammonigenes]MBA2848866.1 hypothetical protein [Thermosulfuriphilus ammonigenes]QIJ71015.1 hypothetical protein G4V39_01445 [Thermosulfuriphilus ammonigenes]
MIEEILREGLKARFREKPKKASKTKNLAKFAARLPILRKSSERLRELVEKAIELVRKDAEEDETTWDFIAPPDWPDGVEAVARRHTELAEIKRQIDEEVYRLYEISEEDRRAIEEELGG